MTSIDHGNELPDSASMELLWSDDFDGEIGSPPDGDRWVYNLGGHGWGNSELQVYTDRRENVSIAADVDAKSGKALAITALTMPDGTITSARITTRGKFQTTYGRFEARIKVPEGQGIWPAFWLLGADMGEVGWPECGEIDIMEWIGRIPGTAFGTVHGPGYSGDEGPQGAYPPTGEGQFSGEYHIFAVDWTPGRIDWYVDGNRYHTLTPAGLPEGTRWVFDHDCYLLLNLAVGGEWPGNPDATTTYPQTLYIDYVRVYRLA
jgi:beta-glucanase (GH16 family)